MGLATGLARPARPLCSLQWPEHASLILHQAVQGGLFRPVTFVVNRRAIGGPVQPMKRGSHARLPRLPRL